MSRSKPVAPVVRQRLPLLPMASCAVALASCAFCVVVFANPEGGVAVVGQATFNTTQPNLLVVTTQNGAGTNHSAINWQSFSIPAGSVTRIDQPSASSLSINRVVTNTPSVLFGTLSSNGSVVLVNQAGIAVGTGALVDTAGFTASAVGMSDGDALAGRLRFGSSTLGATSGALSVQGNIIARNGDVVLIAPTVELARTAVVEARNGSVVLAAGQSVEVTGRGLEGISLRVQAPADSAVNLGTLKGDAVGIFAGTLRHSGLIQATSASLEGGKVVLKSAADTYVEGDGKIIATGTRGGTVDVLGQRVALLDAASIDVSGVDGGGGVRIGGDYQGKNANVQNASMTYVGAGTNLKADAIQTGNGGKVIVWADDTTRVYGNISAQGGARGGDGGFIENSGKNYLDFRATVSTRAANGKRGTLLLDPSDIVIAGTVSSLISGSSPFQGTANSSILGATDLLAALSATDVIVDASGGTGGSTTGDITVNTPLSWSTNTLKLNAHSAGGITINSDMTASTGGLAMSAGSGGITQAASTTVTVNTLEIVSSGNVSLGINSGATLDASTMAANITGGATLDYKDSNGFTVGSVGGTTGITGSGGSINLDSFGGSVVVNNNITNSGGITLSGYGGVTLTGAGVSTTSGTLSISSSMSAIGINSGSYLSAPTITLSSTSGTTVDASTLKIGKIGSIGSASVTGNLTLQGGSTIAMDVASTSSFDALTVTGVYNVASASETLSVADLSGGTASGALSSAVVSSNALSGSTMLLSGPAGWTKTETATSISLTAVASPAAASTTTNQQPLNGASADFSNQFDGLLLAQRDSALTKQKGKDLLVVEGDLCRP